MKIQSISNNIFLRKNNYNTFNQNNLTFRGVDSSGNINPNDLDRFDSTGDNAGNDNNNQQLPEWARKAMLFSLVFFTLKNEPFVQNLFDSGMMSEEELDREEYFENVQSIRKEEGKSSAFYHLNKFYDIEKPKIEALGYNKFSLEFNLDNQKVQMEINFDEENKDELKGKFKLGNNGEEIKYKAVFSPDDIQEFKLFLNDGEEKYILGRDYNGELYKLENGKKVILNSENVEKYEQYLDNLETLDDLSFFTDRNPLWRNLNYLLLIFLLYNEYKHDKNRKNDKTNKE